LRPDGSRRKKMRHREFPRLETKPLRIAGIKPEQSRQNQASQWPDNLRAGVKRAIPPHSRSTPPPNRPLQLQKQKAILRFGNSHREFLRNPRAEKKHSR